MRRRSPMVYFIILAFGAILFAAIDKSIPSQYLPWHKLDVEAPVGSATKTQLLRLALSPNAACQSAIEQAADFKTLAAEPHRPKPPCGWDVARLVYGSTATKLSPGEATMQCPLAIASYIWLREVNAAADRYLGAQLSQIHHAGSYTCRRQIGNSSQAWSEHAFANAWDVTAFELDDGQIISVMRDWDGDNKNYRKFLRTAHDKACQIFRVTLGPEYNSAHKDHFHLDMGPSATCR